MENNIRDLEGLLNKVMFYSQLSGQPASLAIAKEALSGYIETKKEHFDAYDVLSTTCKYFGVSENDVIGKRKTRNLWSPE